LSEIVALERPAQLPGSKCSPPLLLLPDGSSLRLIAPPLLPRNRRWDKPFYLFFIKGEMFANPSFFRPREVAIFFLEEVEADIPFLTLISLIPVRVLRPSCSLPFPMSVTSFFDRGLTTVIRAGNFCFPPCLERFF